MECKVEGCCSPVDRKGYCSVHYMRQWRNGTTDLVQGRSERILGSNGYIRIYSDGHPLEDSTGTIYEHRYVYYESFGKGPFNCYICGDPIAWENLHIDHLDDNKQNNHIENLKPACGPCNQSRGNEKRVATWRKKTGIEYKGKVYSMQELADARGISRASLICRLKKMSIDEAMDKPRGKTGPR